MLILTDNKNVQDSVQNEPNPNTNPKMNPNMGTNPNMEGEQDRNAQILARLGALRRLSSSFRGGDHLRQSLAEELDTTTNIIVKSQGAIYNISSYREAMRQYYSNGLSYKDIKNLNITKDQLFSLF